jgi:hypothetical protein
MIHIAGVLPRIVAEPHFRTPKSGSLSPPAVLPARNLHPQKDKPGRGSADPDAPSSARYADIGITGTMP